MKFSIPFFVCWSSLYALPTGGQVVLGEAAWSASSDALQIQANGKAILQWDGFDVACHEAIHFFQAEKQYPILNRVASSNASEILGTIHSNCPIYLINPNGVVVGTTAVLNTAGFIASTADLSNDSFWTGDSLFFQELGAGSIVNLGKIEASTGDVCLIARSLSNQGEISAEQGLVLLAASEVMLNPETKQSVFIRGKEQERGEICNQGTIRALATELKTQSPYEKAICHQGLIEASKTAHSNGCIYLVAEGGTCVLDAPLTAEGGAIEISAETVHLTQNALLDVSSEKGGGSIQITEVQALLADRGSRFFADAKEFGDGGLIELAAKQDLRFYGQAQACGGTLGGDGGSIHLSSYGPSFHTDPQVSAIAPSGNSGTVVFDPMYITISSDGMDPATGNTFSSNPTGTATISGASLGAALDAANVVLQANTDIVFQDPVAATTLGNSLTLQAGRSIQISSDVTLNGGAFDATINDSGAVAADRASGIASFQLDSGNTIATQGGAINLIVGTFNSLQEGEVYIDGTMDAGGGNISIAGFAGQDTADYAFGIQTTTTSLIQTSGTGTLTLQGIGGSGTNYNAGVYLGGNLQTDTGLLQITGTGGGNGTGNGNVGIFLNAKVDTTSSGPIVFNGTAGSGVSGNMGIYLSQGEISTVNGNITLQGTGAGTGGLNFGIRLESDAQCISSGSGVIALTGTSGNGKNNNHGVILSGGTLSANTGSISITGTGRGAQSYNYGIRLESDSQCISTGTATITLNGQNSSGINGNAGVSISTMGEAITSGYGNVQITGTSSGTGYLNQGVRLEAGQLVSTGTGAGAANIHLTGTGSVGTDYCNGVAVQGAGYSVTSGGTTSFFGTVITSVDGNIILEGTGQGTGMGNQALDIDPASLLQTTGTGTISYIQH